MTRKEQIKEYLLTIGNGEMNVTPFDAGLECGVEWADAHPCWIRVEDELPPKESEYEALSNNVLATDGKEIYESVYNHDFEEWFTHDLWAINNITHWMPMPAPPKSSCSEFPTNCKKLGMKGYENVIIHEGNTKGGER